MNCQLGLTNMKHQDDGYSNGSCDYDGLESGMGNMKNLRFNSDMINFVEIFFAQQLTDKIGDKNIGRQQQTDKIEKNVFLCQQDTDKMGKNTWSANIKLIKLENSI